MKKKFFFHNHGVVSVVATAKEYFFCQNHVVVNVVIMGRKSIYFPWLRRDECSIEMKIYIFVVITYPVNVVAIVSKQKLKFIF